MENDNLVMIPLISKEITEIRLLKVIKFMAILLVVTNCVWATFFVIYATGHPRSSSDELISEQCSEELVNGCTSEESERLFKKYQN